MVIPLLDGNDSTTTRNESIVPWLNKSSEPMPLEQFLKTTPRRSASLRLNLSQRHLSQEAESETKRPNTSSESWMRPSISVKCALPRLQSLQSEGG